MKVAIVHYHFRRGGVTRVVQNAALSLAGRQIQLGVLGGEACSEAFSSQVNYGIVEGLGYSDQADAEALLGKLKSAASASLGGPPDLWHVHNHSLGKNAALTRAVALLAERGERLLLQLHDFPEDGRPENYRNLTGLLPPDMGIYPLAPHVHYAVLNGRDYQFLSRAGVPDERLHLLPNPVALSEPSEPGTAKTPDQDLILYPTRAIRRKNLGEFLLWAATATEREHYAVSLAPDNPLARPVYERWVTFAQELNLPASFEYGVSHPLPFATLLRQASRVATTSVAEGFGLAFLEPWLLEKPLCGRDLPDITQDFRASGVDLSGLYNRLDVPLAWVGEETFRSRLAESLRATYSAYGRVCSESDVELAYQAAVVGDGVDFGRLDEPMQEQVIRQLLDCPDWQSNLRKRIFPEVSEGRCRSNRHAVEANFSLEAYGTMLETLYQTVTDATAGSVDYLPPERLLDQFLAPERFCLLRT
jgi:glycosyltransferase involved in cell wall biosynthesis